MREIRDGDLYKIVLLFGKEFSLYYGYYDDAERLSRYGEPTPVYPDFIRSPVYTDEGIPFATEMQDICEYYQGRADGESCFGCVHFHKGEELIGLCLCQARKNK